MDVTMSSLFFNDELSSTVEQAVKTAVQTVLCEVTVLLSRQLSALRLGLSEKEHEILRLTERLEALQSVSSCGLEAHRGSGFAGPRRPREDIRLCSSPVEIVLPASPEECRETLPRAMRSVRPRVRHSAHKHPSGLRAPPADGDACSVRLEQPSRWMTGDRDNEGFTENVLCPESNRLLSDLCVTVFDGKQNLESSQIKEDVLFQEHFQIKGENRAKQRSGLKIHPNVEETCILIKEEDSDLESICIESCPVIITVALHCCWPSLLSCDFWDKHQLHCDPALDKQLKKMDVWTENQSEKMAYMVLSFVLRYNVHSYLL
ncbi:uncharacterized protein LOC120542242 isoform X2 [Polypterus senegalus]|uniref:uncharacterized protein LOC120542242 isoform X2 n=1 Tax=Polypterus senegalus TaxID=55291 RepID=UPI001966507C|nr:uncharacterized protein LOC120542242 isoform X2 [Polypterus senegalus]